jgi:hypothetical protein
MMAAKFTAGDSIKSTREITNQRPKSNARTHSHDGPKAGNTMNGMPGYINAHQDESMSHAKGGKGFGPHREGPVGKRGSSGAKSMGKSKTGTTTPSYHADSTRSAGTLKEPNNTGSNKVHTRSTGGPMPGQKPPPTSKGILGGTVRKAGIDQTKTKGFQAAIGHDTGHKGRMEHLSGRARTHAEGRRKSVMY